MASIPTIDEQTAESVDLIRYIIRALTQLITDKGTTRFEYSFN